MATFEFGGSIDRRACAVLGHMPEPIMVDAPDGKVLGIVCKRCKHYLI